MGSKVQAALDQHAAPDDARVIHAFCDWLESVNEDSDDDNDKFGEEIIEESEWDVVSEALIKFACRRSSQEAVTKVGYLLETPITEGRCTACINIFRKVCEFGDRQAITWVLTLATATVPCANPFQRLQRC